MEQLISFQSKIAGKLDEEMEHFLAPVKTNTLKEILTYYYNLGGKKIRPALFVAVSEALHSEENIWPFALILELIHNMSLYHDDVIDGAKERRGAPTIHLKWDNVTAIVGGDILHALIHAHILSAIEKDRISNTEIALKFLKELIQIVELKIGEAVILEMRLSKSKEIPNLETVIEITKNKTAPLFAFSTSSAVYLSGGSADLSEEFYELGLKFGFAFQLLDDIQDYFPSEKGIGNDLRTDKKTPILVLASKQDKSLVNKFRSKGINLKERDIIKFREIFKPQIITTLEWIKSNLNESKKIFEYITEEDQVENLQAIYFFLEHKIDEFSQVLEN